MSSHLMTRHVKAATRRHLWAPQTNGGPRTYKMHFPAKGGRRRCLAERCPGVLETRAAMRVHFVYRHVHNTVVILEEGNLPLPRFPRCDLQVVRKALNRRHLDTWRSHRGHRGRGRLPFSIITTVSWTCRCTKCTRIAARVANTPGHPSTGHRLLPCFAGKCILYILGPPFVWGAQRCHRVAAFPCGVIM